MSGARSAAVSTASPATCGSTRAPCRPIASPSDRHQLSPRLLLKCERDGARMLDTRSLELFVDFVRKNPWLPANDPVMMRAFHAYVKVEEEEVPKVEVTYDEPQPTLAGSLVHVEALESPLERRRSGAKNLSD